MRSGVDFNNKGQLKNMLKPENEDGEPEKLKKLPDLKKVPLISNDLDWKARIPDQALLLRNIDNAVDNYIENIVIDLMNEYNNLKSLQYKDINNINKELKEPNRQYSPKHAGGLSRSKNRETNDFDFMDEFNAL